MIKVSADLFSHVTQRLQAGVDVSVLLPMSPYKKRNGDAVMGAGILRRFVERFPDAPSRLGALLPPLPERPTLSDFGACGRITHGENFSGVRVHAWLIQPHMGYAADVYSHLADRFGEAAEEYQEENPDVPGWACCPWESAVRASVQRIATLSARGEIIVPYPHLGHGMSGDAFNQTMSALPDNVFLLTRAEQSTRSDT